MNCLKAEEQFSAYIEDELDYRAVRTFEAHLNACESCRREFTLFRESLDLLYQLPQIEPSADFDTALKVRIADTQVESTPFWGRVLQPLHGQVRLALSGVAVMLVMVAGFYFYQKTSINPELVEIVAAPDSSRRAPLAGERRIKWQRQQFPLAIPSQEPQSLVNFPESSVDLQPVRRNQQTQFSAFNVQPARRSQQPQFPVFDLQPVRRNQQTQRLEQNYILQTINYTEVPTGGGL
jgi:hypothetical protein